ncbi:MAG: magnesium transporter CorA family protein [Alphaproteobacteria bacterium]|nr:magnesium transporter CorA family protein [Alphaproteobacteria bacterium]
MLTEHQSGGKTVWVDLFNPTDAEIAQACSKCGLDIPPRDQLEEIEFSSRLQYEDGTFTISVPVTPHYKEGGEDVTSPLGFVLTKDLLVTVRFAQLHTFDAITERVNRRTRSAPDIFLVILEAMIDYGADRLEELRAEALKISQRIFHKDMQDRQKNKVARVNRMLRDTLVEIGDMGERLSYIRDTLLVLQRAVPFVTEHGDGWLEDLVKARLKMAGADVQSLNEYEVHLTDKLQFLLDADLGFIATEQNDLFKIMTIWSVVGIPPVLVAGIYGMNFHVMPELAWPFGYPFALVLIAVSALIPLMWFKHKGWWE